MTYFPDLAPCTYGRREADPRVLAVGWLERGEPYAVGKVPAEFVSALLKLYQDHQSNFTRGWHSCPFCPEGAAKPKESVSSAEIQVERRGIVYRAPALILHYVLAHQYLPPSEFVEAVLDGTPLHDPPLRDTLHNAAERLRRVGLHDTANHLDKLSNQ